MRTKSVSVVVFLALALTALPTTARADELSETTQLEVSVTEGDSYRKGARFYQYLFVTVTADDSPVAGATVGLTILTDGCSGSPLISAPTGTTDSSGELTYMFSTGKTRNPVTYGADASASMSGYTDESACLPFTFFP
jgi:hypothetical protein